MSNRFAESGISLIEISVALVIVGLLMITVIQAYEQEVIDAQTRKTDENLKTVQTALQNFYYINNRLPCPADPSLKSTDPEEGKEKCIQAHTESKTGSVPFVTLNLPYK